MIKFASCGKPCQVDPANVHWLYIQGTKPGYSSTWLACLDGQEFFDIENSLELRDDIREQWRLDGTPHDAWVDRHVPGVFWGLKRTGKGDSDALQQI